LCETKTFSLKKKKKLKKADLLNDCKSFNMKHYVLTATISILACFLVLTTAEDDGGAVTDSPTEAQTTTLATAPAVPTEENTAAAASGAVEQTTNAATSDSAARAGDLQVEATSVAEEVKITIVPLASEAVTTVVNTTTLDVADNATQAVVNRTGSLANVANETTARTTAAVNVTLALTTVAMTTQPFKEIITVRNYTGEMNGSVVTLKLKKKLTKAERQNLIISIMKHLNSRARAAKQKTSLANNSSTSTNNTAAGNVTSHTTAAVAGATSQADSVTPTSAANVTSGADRPVVRRRRRDASGSNEDEFKLEDIVVVDDGSGDDTVGIAVKTKDGQFMDDEDLLQALKEIEDKVEEDTGLAIEPVKGSPAEVKQAESATTGFIHLGLLITIIVVIIVFVLLVLIIYTCPESHHPTVREDKMPMTLESGVSQQKHPIVMSSPFTDEELVESETPAPHQEQQQAAPPASKAAAPERASLRKKKDGPEAGKNPEDNGWVVPLEELKKASPAVETARF